MDRSNGFASQIRNSEIHRNFDPEILGTDDPSKRQSLEDE